MLKRRISNRIRLTVRFIVFAAVFAAAVQLVNRLLMPKYLYDNAGPVTETYNGFYHMKRDTVDVIIAGSSQAATSLNPQVFYNEEKVRAYNLSSPMQNVRDSYYWVKEAFRTQKPKVVILEAYNLFNDDTGEVPSRNALDYMRNDPVKLEDVRETAEASPDGGELSYYLTNIRYHERWKELEENDFGLGMTEKPSALKGFWNFTKVYGTDDFTPLSLTGMKGTEGSLAPGAESYLKRLTELCKEHGCTLILLKAPWSSWPAEDHVAVSRYAKEHGIAFYDFNTEQLYQGCGFDYAQDIDDSNGYGAHCNTAGAVRISRFMAEELINRKLCGPQEDEQWEETKEVNDQAYKDFILCNTQDAASWMSMLQDSRYTVIFSRNAEAGGPAEFGLPENLRKPVDALGLSFDAVNDAEKNYASILEGADRKEEKSQKDPIDWRSSFRNGKVRLEVISGSGTPCIRINGEEETAGQDGLNIVVYNNEIHQVIDSAVIDPEQSLTGLVR